MHNKLSNRRTSIADALQERLATENRRVLSDWRAVLLLRKASREISIGDRRWQTPPRNVFEIRPVLNRLSKAGELVSLEGFPFLYRVNAPYARSAAVEEEEVLLELHPYAALSHFSALAFHQMTEQLSKDIHVTVPDNGPGRFLPLGTKSEDWEGVALVRGRVVDSIFGRRIHWHRLVSNRIFGTSVYDHHGYPVRVTAPERTLLDGLLQPNWSGGFANVLHAWAAYRDLIDLKALVKYVDQLDVRILRQRAGFLMEELGLRHPALDLWVTRAQRGGSSKLNGAAEFSSQFSERWLLSINAPISVLHEART
jgi:predicted transcriptional regulator of viral defense system